MAWSGSFFVLSLLLHVILIGGATILVVQVVKGQKEKLKFTAPPPAPPAEHSVKPSKKTSAAAPAISKRITSTAANASIALPPVEMDTSMPDVMASAMSGLGASGLGSGAVGTGSAGMASMPLTGLTAFGFKGSGKQGLVGTFYDLKQTADGKTNEMSETPVEVAGGISPAPDWSKSAPMKKYVSVLKDFVRSWDTDILNKYFKAPNKITGYQFIIPYMRSDEAPKVFNVDKTCKPRRWIIHYKGSFKPTKSGTFRFVGYADDILFVRLNGRNVLDSNFFWQDLDSKARVVGKNDAAGGIGAGAGPIGPLWPGIWFNLIAGEKTDIEIIIGEGPGGAFGVDLMIQEKGVDYPLGDYPAFQLKDMPLPDNMRPGKGGDSGTVPPAFSGKKMVFPGI